MAGNYVKLGISDKLSASCSNKSVRRTVEPVAAMGGTDAIVFTGGIGENNPLYRTYVCEKLKFLGVRIDEEKNKLRGEEIEISTPESTVRVFVIPTNEELVIARDTLEIVENLK